MAAKLYETVFCFSKKKTEEDRYPLIVYVHFRYGKIFYIETFNMFLSNPLSRAYGEYSLDDLIKNMKNTDNTYPERNLKFILDVKDYIKNNESIIF